MGRTFSGHEDLGNELIKTLLIKIVHNKNYKVLHSSAGIDSAAEKSTGLAFKRPFIHLLTNRASFLQY
ncbi:hypothetical protein [Pseudomonas graminis]